MVGTFCNQPGEPSAAASYIQQARIYAVMEQEAKESPNVIIGKAHINGKLACILVNLSATFSFKSSIYMMHW